MIFCTVLPGVTPITFYPAQNRGRIIYCCKIDSTLEEHKGV